MNRKYTKGYRARIGNLKLGYEEENRGLGGFGIGGGLYLRQGRRG